MRPSHPAPAVAAQIYSFFFGPNARLDSIIPGWRWVRTQHLLFKTGAHLPTSYICICVKVAIYFYLIELSDSHKKTKSATRTSSSSRVFPAAACRSHSSRCRITGDASTFFFLALLMGNSWFELDKIVLNLQICLLYWIHYSIKIKDWLCYLPDFIRSTDIKLLATFSAVRLCF